MYKQFMNTSSTSNHHKSPQKLGLNMSQHSQHIQSISGSSTAMADAFLGSKDAKPQSSAFNQFRISSAFSFQHIFSAHVFSIKFTPLKPLGIWSPDSTKALGYLGRRGFFERPQLQAQPAQPACCECGPLVTHGLRESGRFTSLYESISGAWCFYCEAVEALKIFDLEKHAIELKLLGSVETSKSLIKTWLFEHVWVAQGISWWRRQHQW